MRKVSRVPCSRSNSRGEVGSALPLHRWATSPGCSGGERATSRWVHGGTWPARRGGTVAGRESGGGEARVPEAANSLVIGIGQ